jgi:hypothetical protein
MPEHELTKDGATWFWFPDFAEEGEPFAGCWVPSIQWNGSTVGVDGIAFYTEAECQAWIDEAVKAAPGQLAAVAGRPGYGRGGQSQSEAVHAAVREILDLTSQGTDLVKSHAYFRVLRDLYLAGKTAGEGERS